MHLVYDVSNRESFEALPRWLEELDIYVPSEVMKIVIGKKLDKVKSYPHHPSRRPLTRDTHTRTHARTPI
jgi:GTPase SAR1 family protein